MSITFLQKSCCQTTGAYRAVTDAFAPLGVTRIGDLLPSLMTADSEPPQLNLIPLPRYDVTPLYTL